MKAANFLAKLLLTGSLFMNLSCDDEIKAPEISKPDSQALINWFNSGTANQVQHFTLSSITGGTVSGSQGTRLQFEPNGFTKSNGDAITGSVDIELIEIYDRATMLLTKRPTNGKTEDGMISTLISGGEFYVSVSQHGSQLKLKNGYTLVAPTENTGEIDHDMSTFTGEVECEDNNCKVVWEENVDRKIQVGEFQVTGGFKTAYYVFQSEFGWTNIDRWYNDPRPKTTIFVDVPDGFDNTNCAVFVAYEGEPTALAGFDRYDEDKNLFTEHYGLIPVGLKVHFILVSIIDEEIHYAVQSATLTENHVEVIDNVQSITIEQLTELVNGLP